MWCAASGHLDSPSDGPAQPGGAGWCPSRCAVDAAGGERRVPLERRDVRSSAENGVRISLWAVTVSGGVGDRFARFPAHWMDGVCPAPGVEPARPRRAPDCGGRGVVSVPMDLSSGQPVVEVYLNGKGPFRMFLDTGAGSTVLDRSLADELALRHVGKTRMGDPANPEAIAADLVRIDSLRIGPASFEGIEAASWDRSGLRRDANPPRGVIGFALFRELLLTLDYPGAQVRLAHGTLPIWCASTRCGSARRASRGLRRRRCA